MFYFMVWEVYDSHWVLQEKGYDFIKVDSNKDVTMKVFETQHSLAKKNGVEPKQCVITTLQPV